MRTFSLFCLLILFFTFSCDNSKSTNVVDDEVIDSIDDGPDATTLQLVNAFPDLSFERPVDFQSSNDGSQRIFVVEQRGKIKVFANDQNVGDTTTFLDLENKIETNANEQGLLGLAFHPDFGTNGYFYVSYNPSENRTVISRFQVSSSNTDLADAGSELILLEFPQPFENHNGGQLAFGPDGYLYISSGDGGSGGDPQNNAQNRSNLLGAILRIDVDNTANGLNYAIPADNPFVGEADVREEIYAYGLRNPWRMSFDTATGNLWTGDVGQNEIEEIDIIQSGGNYGWKLFEGTSCFSGDCNNTGLIAPIFEYDQTANDKSITGGFVYHGNAAPSLTNKYVYADFVSERIWAMNLDGSNNELLLESGLNISSFGTDANQELYVCAFDGNIYKFQL